MSATARPRNNQLVRGYRPQPAATCDRLPLPALLLLLAAGLGLWLFSLLPAPVKSAAGAYQPSSYLWLDDAGQSPAGIYRLAMPPSPGALQSGAVASRDWGRKGPAHLAIFTFQPIAINRAEAPTLSFLPGIGPVLAQRIVDHRTTHGPFRQHEELLRVHGIGPKTLAEISPLISVD